MLTAVGQGSGEGEGTLDGTWTTTVDGHGVALTAPQPLRPRSVVPG